MTVRPKPPPPARRLTPNSLRLADVDLAHRAGERLIEKIHRLADAGQWQIMAALDLGLEGTDDATAATAILELFTSTRRSWTTGEAAQAIQARHPGITYAAVVGQLGRYGQRGTIHYTDSDGVRTWHPPSNS